MAFVRSEVLSLSFLLCFRLCFEKRTCVFEYGFWKVKILICRWFQLLFVTCTYCHRDVFSQFVWCVEALVWAPTTSEERFSWWKFISLRQSRCVGVFKREALSTLWKFNNYPAWIQVMKTSIIVIIAKQFGAILEFWETNNCSGIYIVVKTACSGSGKPDVPNFPQHYRIRPNVPFDP